MLHVKALNNITLQDNGDRDTELGHMTFCRPSLIDLYLQAKFYQSWKTF